MIRDNLNNKITKFKLKKTTNMTEKEIHFYCEKYEIENYIINEDMSIDVDGDVNLSQQNLTELPLNFNKVSGDFCCAINHLTSLVGCPKEVGGDFQCNYNKLKTLLYSPKVVGGVFDSSNNRLTSLEGCQFDFMAINFEYNDITPKSLFELDDKSYEKAIKKFDELTPFLGVEWCENFFDISKREFEIQKRQYTIGKILA